MWRDLGIALLLTLAILAVYVPVARYPFIHYDDRNDVYNCEPVRDGLSWEGFLWSWTSIEKGNWMPLTRLSHMLVCQGFGLRAGWHHLANVALHLAATLLLYGVLKRMTAAPWPSAVVAALFAVHPLHVESVAWVAERKDVLSTVFWMLTLAAYVRYAAQPGWRRYLPVPVLMALGLMAKPMLVTIPLVLLLLDYWPLRRLDRATAGRRVLEKIPLVVLAAASSVVTYVVQERGGAMVFAEKIPLLTRLANAVTSYVGYLGQTVWPTRLAIFYPYVTGRPAWQVAAAAGLLVGLTVLAVVQARRRPYLAVGWFWHLGTLVPVIGLVQVGEQAMADRYTYVPLIGIFFAIVWAASDLAAGWRWRRPALAAAATAVVFACMILAARQVRTWSDSETLFRHALDVTENNAVAEFNLGEALFLQDKRAEATIHYAAAVRLNPNDAASHNNYGWALAQQGDLPEGVAHYRVAIRLAPRYADAHSNLGLALTDLGQFEEAVRHLEEALRFNPAGAATYHINLGATLAAQGKPADAIAQYREALRLEPRSVVARGNMGTALLNSGRPQEALAVYREALAINPAYPKGHLNLAIALARLDQVDEANGHFAEAMRLKPDWPEALGQLARVRAVHPDPRFRNGAQAVALAERLCVLTQRRDPLALATLAAAYAEAGRFPDAVTTVQEAMALAAALGRNDMVADWEKHLALYRAGKPFRLNLPMPK